MYLSQLILNPRSKQVQSELGNPYELHRTILTAFPNTLDPNERILYRLEPDFQGEQLTLLVQSINEPNWSALSRDNYLLNDVQVKTFSPTVVNQQIYLFRLLANPTKKIKITSDRPSKRVGLYRQEEQIDWIIRKGNNHGFTIISVNLTQVNHQTAYKKELGRPKKAKLTHQGVRFEGLLEVNDAEKFQEALRNGIGSGKAFGFGLLSIAKNTEPV